MANTYKRTIVLGLDYSEFSGGIAECNRKMSLLDSEMKYAESCADAYGTATDRLKVKQDGLKQKIQLQKKIVEQQVDAYQKAVSKGKDNEKQTDRLAKAVADSRTKLVKLEEAYEDNNKQLKEYEKKTKKAADANSTFGDIIRDVADFVGVNANPVIENLASKFDEVDRNVGNAILTCGGLVATLGGLTLKTADQAKEIMTVSQTMGMTTNQYQVWDYILKSVGYDAESASGDLAALAEKAKDAAEGGNDSAKTFRMLGISVKDSSGNLKSQNQLFTEVVFALRNMEDITTRNAIASDLLSTTGEKLVPILNMSKEEFKGLKNEAYETGNVMSEETLEGFGELNKSMADFQGSVDGLEKSFGVVLLPILTDFFDAIASIPTPVLGMLIRVVGMTAGIMAVGKAISSVVDGFKTFGGILGGFDAKAMKTTAIVLGIVAAMIALATIIAVIVGKSADLNRTMDTVSSSVGTISKAVHAQQTKYNASGSEYFEGGETWVGEQGPELVRLPRGSRIYTAEESRRKLGGNTYIFQIDSKNVKEFNRLVEMAEKEQVAIRTGVSKI